jgi:hypothetical protein
MNHIQYILGASFLYTNDLPKLHVHYSDMPAAERVASCTPQWGLFQRFKHMCKRSKIRSPSKSSMLHCLHKSRKISLTLLRKLPYSFFCQYFGTNTTWYLKSN